MKETSAERVSATDSLLARGKETPSCDFAFLSSSVVETPSQFSTLDRLYPAPGGLLNKMRIPIFLTIDWVLKITHGNQTKA